MLSLDQMDHPKTGEKVILEQSPPKRGPLGDRWLFTFNNYSESDLDRLDQILRDNENVLNGCYGLELAPTTGTAHVQGYIEFVKRKRPTEMKVFDRRIHWGDGPDEEFIRTKGKKGSSGGRPCKKHCTQIMNMEYCSKTRDVDDVPNEVFKMFQCSMPRPLRLITEGMFFGWQRELVDIFKDDAAWNCRTIYWIYGEFNIGKTQFVKYLCAKHGGYILDGEKRHVLSKAYKSDSRLYIMPLACGDNKISYRAIEQIKDGCFAASFGTECNGMCIRNAPHILITGNLPPDTKDPNYHPTKYRVFEIRGEELVRQ